MTSPLRIFFALYLILAMPGIGRAQVSIPFPGPGAASSCPVNGASTKSLLHADGTNGGTSFPDSATGGTHTWTAHGATVTDTSQKVFGTASAKFTGSTSDYLDTSSSSDFGVGTGDFTNDFWIRFNSIASSQGLASDNVNESTYFVDWTTSNLIRVQLVGGTVHTFSFTPSTGNWYWIQIKRTSGTIQVSVSAAGGGAVSSLGTAADSGSLASFGLLYGNRGDHAEPMNGWVDEAHWANVTTATPGTAPVAAYCP